MFNKPRCKPFLISSTLTTRIEYYLSTSNKHQEYKQFWRPPECLNQWSQMDSFFQTDNKAEIKKTKNPICLTAAMIFFLFVPPNLDVSYSSTVTSGTKVPLPVRVEVDLSNRLWMHYRGPLEGKGWGAYVSSPNFKTRRFAYWLRSRAAVRRLLLYLHFSRSFCAVSTMFMSFVPVSTSLMSLFKATSLVEILP